MTDNNCGIYKITNTINGNTYIGSSINIHRRFVQHRHLLNHNKHDSKHLQNAWNKYGEQAFVFETVLLCDKDYTIYFEQLLLDYLCPIYNTAKNATRPTLGLKRSEETRRKISEANKMRPPISEETRRKRSESMMGKKFDKDFGQRVRERMLGTHPTKESRRKMSEAQHKRFKEYPVTGETRRKIGEAHKGVPLSEEHKRKMSEAQKGKVNSEESRRKMSEAHKGVPLSEEHKRKMSEAQKGKVVSEETRRKISEAMKGNKHRAGHKHTEESRKKVSEANKRYWAERKLANTTPPTHDCYRTEKLD